jgi:molecular chaperone GrpE (heat shock protein)
MATREGHLHLFSGGHWSLGAGMALQAVLYEIDKTLFQPPAPGPRRPKSAPDGAKAQQEGSTPSSAEELEAWRKRAEEIAGTYQQLLNSYRQLKAHLKEEGEWHHRCNGMLAGALRNCRDLELALEAATGSTADMEGGVNGLAATDPAFQRLVEGIRQVLESQLQQLQAQELIEAIEPQPAELFDETIHEVIGSVPTDELAEGLIAEVAQIGYAYQGKPIRKAQVILAGAGGEPVSGRQTTTGDHGKE